MNNRIEIYTLKYPVEYGDTVVSELHLRRPRGKQLKRFNLDALDSGNIGAYMEALADLSDQAPAMIDMMEGEDIFAASKVVGDFLRDIGQYLTEPSAS